MSLELITKKAFDELYRNAIDDVEADLYESLARVPLDKELIREHTNTYLFLLDFRRMYTALKHEYHLAHYLNGNSITYTKNGKIVLGFKHNGK